MKKRPSKTKWFLVLSFALVFHATSAQNIEVGLKSGINFARLTYPSGTDQFKAGFNGGAFAQLKMGKFILQPEILYSQQGNSLKITVYSPAGTSLTSNLKSIFNYINLPIIAKYKLGKVFNVQAGPQLGFILVAKDQNLVSSSYQDVKDANSSDFSFALGCGADFPIGITLDARFNAGLTNVTTVSNAKNQVIQMSVGYRFLKLK